MFYNDDDAKRIKDAADGHLVDVIQDFRDLRKSGSELVCDCPVCKATRKFFISPSKQIFKCFSCNQPKGNDSLSYLMGVENMNYAEALEHLAKKFCVLIDHTPVVKHKSSTRMKEGSKKTKGMSTKTYCARMLAASGLTFEDVTAKVYKSDNTKSVFECKTFKPGTIDEHGTVTDNGDDVIIEYYDLDGLPVTYLQKYKNKRSTEVRKEYFRVRWQFPDMHLDKEGKPFKYKSPPGSGTPIYIPQRLRQMYKEKKKIPRLYIQEGEKKAEKACKHGIPSVAVSGIQNLGMNGTIPEDMVRIITTCQVEEVAFIFDSDWNDISQNIKINDPVERRPRCFFFAAKNFKEYMRTLKNRNIYVEIFIGHINKNQADDKGLDDLLANTLAGKEEELATDIEHACNEKNGLGEYVEMFKVTTWTDHKLMELWSLHSQEAFAAQHKSILKNLPEFLFNRYRWKFDEDGKVILAQPFDDDEKFWTVIIKNEGKENRREDYEFCYTNSQNFLQNRGFGRMRRMDNSSQYIHLDPPIVSPIEASDARDFLFQFAKHNCPKAVVEMLIKGVSQYVGPDKLSLLEYIQPNFVPPKRESQFFYFAKSCWLVEKDRVQELGYENITHHIWEEQRKMFPAKYIGQPLISFEKRDGQYSYKISDEGMKSHFLQFLINTSNFSWRKNLEEIDPEEEKERRIHILSKLCAIGYMAMEAKDNNVTKAVIGMDGIQSEVGESNGRSGKSLIGELMRHATPTVYIPGKRLDIFNDQFIWNDVKENTNLVFIDDVLLNFNFEFLFPNLTGDWTVNRKGKERVTLPFLISPKIYIATNHTIRGSGSSFADRQWLLAFSDFYNDQHKPIDDFGCLFFSEWDFEQWNLTWNLLANCIQLYLTYGVIQAPGERLELRKLRQEMGEALISWADEYFSSAEHVNNRIPRKDLYDAFCTYDQAQRKFISSTAFKKKLIMYCEWKGYVFNPQKYDSKTGKPFQVDKDGKAVVDDKAGGIEYFTIGVDNLEEHPVTDALGLPENQSKIDF